MTKLGGIGKLESVFFCGNFLGKLWKIGIGGRAGQGVAAVQPLHQITITAAGGAKGGVFLYAGLAADRAFSGRHAATV
jgi:hypothetical protein